MAALPKKVCFSVAFLVTLCVSQNLCAETQKLQPKDHACSDLRPIFSTNLVDKNDINKYTSVDAMSQVTVSFSREKIESLLIIGVLIVQMTIIIVYFFRRRTLLRKLILAFKNQSVLEFQLVLTRRYLEKERKKQKALEQKLELIHKQLTSYNLSYEQKTKVIDQLQAAVERLEATTAGTENENLINKIKKLTKESLSIDKNWQVFRSFFEEAQFGFNAKLLSKHPNLKPNDLKLCALIRHNLSIKETAEILGISPGSVKTSRYRLRKKLHLAPKEEIIDYLVNLEAEDVAPSATQDELESKDSDSSSS